MGEEVGLVVLGSGGHALTVAEAAETTGREVSRYIDVHPDDYRSGFSSVLYEIARSGLASGLFVLGIGSNHIRAKLHERVSQVHPGALFPPIFHSTAWVSPSARIEAGAILLAHASAGHKARMGVGSLINTGGSLDHNSTLGDYGSLGPGARTGGNVAVGARTMVGLQAGILHGRSVGDDTVIGAQSLVLEDIPGLCVAYGSPCSVVRERQRDDNYY